MASIRNLPSLFWKILIKEKDRINGIFPAIYVLNQKILSDFPPEQRRYGRPISTGNWGCGAFGGDPHLKSLLQWLAASYAGTPSLIYYTFNHHKMGKFQEVIETIQNRGWDVSQLMQAIRRYCITAESELRLTGAVSKDLFTVILQGEVFPGT